MSLQIKEMLKQICVNNGWSYAIFWRINCSNPMLLMPEDSYYEPPMHSVALDSSSVTKGWEALSEHSCSIQGKCEDERIALLMKKIYQVHLVGEGIIGRVASTGKHQWIFQDAYCGQQCWMSPVGSQTMSQDTAELKHQFSAGIKTIAIISVAPHGVVQFGSTQKSMENLKMVEAIKSSFLLLENEAGTFLSGNTQKSPYHTVSNSATCGTFTSMVSPRNFYSEHANFKSMSNDVFKDQMAKTQFSTILTQSSNPSASWSHCGSMPLHDLAVPVSSNPNIPPDSSGLHKKTALYTRNPSFHLRNQYQTAGTEAQMLLSTPNMRLPHAFLQSNLNSSNGNRLLLTSRPNSSDLSTLTSMEQKLLYGMGIQGLQNTFPSNAPTLAPCRATLPNLGGASLLNPLLETSGSLDTIIHPSPFEIKNDLYVPPSSSSSSLLQVIGCDQSAGRLSSRTSSFVLDHVKQSTNSDTFPREFRPVHEKMDLSPCTASPLEPVNNGSLGSINNELLQALNFGFQTSGLAGSDGQTWFGDKYGKDVEKSMVDSVSGSIRSVKENQGSVAVSDTKQNSLNAPMQLPPFDELFGGSGLDFGDSHRQACWDDILLPVGGVDCSNLSTGISELDSVSMIGLEKGYFSDIGSEHLLDAVVANVSSGTNMNPDDRLSQSTLTGASSGCLYTSSGHLVGLSCVGENVDNLLTGNGERTVRGSQKEMLSRSQISSWVEQSQSISAENAVFGQSRSVKEPPKVTRKRARPGESSRPRPKDRQQIQDRVKELREIVPNGAKCSIDALLDRTIRHMCFLQSVTKHADKVKQVGEPKMIGKESGFVLKDALEGGGGATWAFEVGGQSMVCPILIEDLNPPGQMLVEMLCEEHGFFLEIADIIRGFGLTILKGVMEVRDDKIWARFVVEANVKVTRTDIFLSLIQLLKQTSKNSEVIDAGSPVFTTYQQSPMPLPVSLAEKLQ